MRSVATEQEMEPLASPGGAPSTGDNLALLHQGILTTITRLRSGQQQISDTRVFRKRIIDQLDEVEREAARLGYRGQGVIDAKYAVVAFLDETVFISNDPRRNEWSALQSDLFGKAVAGEDFFKRLDALRKQPQSIQLADTLEVYLLCLLLGYLGRYGRTSPGELQVLIEDLQQRIEHIRSRTGLLSPGGEASHAEAAALAPVDAVASRLRWTLVAGIVCVVLLWIICKLLVNSQANDLLRFLQQNG